jgi:HK97 gp10 family phage protein
MAGRGPKVKFEWAGVKELMNTYNQVGIKLDDRDPDVKAIIMTPAAAMVINAQNLAPIAKKIEKKASKKYPPGTLKRSIIATPGPAKQRGIFIVARRKIAYYAVFLEFGTSKMSAQPFFRPAIQQFMSTYAADIAPGVQRLLEATAAANAVHPT